MKHELTPEEMIRAMGGDRSNLPFLSDFSRTLKEKVGQLLEANANAILSEAIRMYADDGKGDIPITLNAKVLFTEDRKVKVKGYLKYERKTQVKEELQDLVYDTQQPDLPFGEEPTAEDL